MSEYRATHTDGLTRILRTLGWVPDNDLIWHVCGCQTDRLCDQHATIRAAEHYHPELGR